MLFLLLLMSSKPEKIENKNTIIFNTTFKTEIILIIFYEHHFLEENAKVNVKCWLRESFF